MDSRRDAVVRRQTAPTFDVASVVAKVAPAGRYADLDPDKLRGGYYTSAALADWVCKWAIRTDADRVLEPSCGDGSILLAAARRLIETGTGLRNLAGQITGVEILEREALTAYGRLAALVGSGAKASVVNRDFFHWSETAEGAFDAVVGNPPFIRYQSFPEPHRTLAMKLMANQGFKPNRLTNIWVPFVAVAAEKLKTGGRLALILPAEVLQVTYAGQLRSFLNDRFASIDIVTCNELFFAKAEQEVILLLADGARPTGRKGASCRITLTETRSVDEITATSPDTLISRSKPKVVHHDSEKWLKYFLTNAEIGLMRRLRESEAVVAMSAHAEVDVGVVTGKNEFFVLSADQIATHRLTGLTVPLVSRSAHLKGSVFLSEDWNELSRSDHRVHLLDLAGATAPLTAALSGYVALGELRDVHRGYKCSIRKPWYAVPSTWIPEAFMFRQIYDFPRIVSNRAGATSTDTIHRLRSLNGNADAVIAHAYSHLTAASAEIEGRSYGGGVLELEPTEAERLLMPAVLKGAMPLEEIDRLARSGKLKSVLEEHDRSILGSTMGLSVRERASLKAIWDKMRDRRLSRRRQSIAGVSE